MYTIRNDRMGERRTPSAQHCMHIGDIQEGYPEAIQSFIRLTQEGRNSLRIVVPLSSHTFGIPRGLLVSHPGES